MAIDTRESLIRRAITCFSKKGFEATTFDAIAKEAGVSRPLVTHYFKRKDDLFLACVQHVGASAQAIEAAR